MTDSHLQGSTTRTKAAPAGVLAAILTLGMTSAALAQVAFDAPAADFSGQVMASGPDRGPVLPGSEITLRGQNFEPGQEVRILHGTDALTDEALVADDEGGFETSITLPQDAAVGVHPLVLTTAEPYHAEIFELKISPEVPLSGEGEFELESASLVRGLYQSAYSAKSDAIFVTSAVGRPPVTESELLKLDPETLEITAQITPAEAPAQGDRPGGVYAVYGLAVDDENDTVWVTNTRQNTVAIYAQDDLSLVKQFEPGLVTHSRDAVVANGKVYVSPVGEAFLAVFDAASQEFDHNLDLPTNQRRASFSPASLQLDEDSGKLYVVSLSTAEVAIIDTATDEVEKLISVEGVRSAIGVAYDPETNRIFVAAQGSDNLVIVDAESGETLHNVPVGAGALNVSFEPQSRLAFVSNRGAGTVTVVNPDGEIVANLPNGSFPNHVANDGKGHVFAINKARGENDPQGDRITRITPRG